MRFNPVVGLCCWYAISTDAWTPKSVFPTPLLATQLPASPIHSKVYNLPIVKVPPEQPAILPSEWVGEYLEHQGLVNCQLKTTSLDGTTHVRLEPLDFIARLVALVRKSRGNMSHYNGPFSSRVLTRVAAD